MSSFKQATKERFEEKAAAYRNMETATQWVEANASHIKTLLETPLLRDFVFEPFKAVFKTVGHTPNDQVKSIITKVALINAVLAGLPGKMGVGVFVSIGFELWMAFAIAMTVGITVEKPRDVVKYFGVMTGVVGMVFFGFKELLGFGFSLFAFLPTNPLIAAELFVTNLVGILFYVGFTEAKQTGSFQVPRRALAQAIRETFALLKYQLTLLKSTLTPANIKLVGQRLMSFLRGDLTADMPALRGDVFVPLAMTWLLAKEAEKLGGTLGEMFLASIRQAYPDLAEASLDEMADHFSAYDAEQMTGAFNLLKGQMFERMVEVYENADGDAWLAELHDDRNVPGSDIVFTHGVTGEQMIVSLKATDNPYYLNEALARYPDIPIVTTDEVASLFSTETVQASGISHASLVQVTEENFEELLWDLPSYEAVIGGGLGLSAAASLYPFVVAYVRQRISQKQLTRATVRVFGDSGKTLAIRLSYSAALGPIFAWYVLARAVSGATVAVSELSLRRRRLVQRGAEQVQRDAVPQAL